MPLVAPDSVVEYIHEHGGHLYVWVKQNRCCSGGFSTLGTATQAPTRITFRRADESVGFQLHIPAALGRLPDELHLELRRFPRRVEAYWNGCAWVT
jgi:hypothetical protein